MKNFIKMCAVVASFFVTDMAAAEVYLYNSYGAGIIYRLTVKAFTEEKVLGNLATIQLYNTAWPNRPTILIRTNKSYSRFTDLKPYLDQIAQEEAAHPRQDAYISINPSSLYQEWNISIHWQAETFRKALESKRY